MKNKKGHSDSLEFLMTYGWAILVVIVAIGLLAYFGVLSPELFSNSYFNSSGVADMCNMKNESVNKLICVAQYYDDSNLSNMPNPCNVASNFYCNVFNKMDGFKCDKIILNDVNHALSIVTYDNRYCIFDMNFRKCLTLESD